jgi:hypothetical protein
VAARLVEERAVCRAGDEISPRRGRARPGDRKRSAEVPVIRFQERADGDVRGLRCDADEGTANAAKHGVTFEEAVTVFPDLDYLLVRAAVVPERLVAIGMSTQARVLFVVHCKRGERVRIIGARRATSREREPMNNEDEKLTELSHPRNR